jgi:hypothetical protein
MSYIGSTPTTQSFIAGTDSFNGTGSATNFTLSRFVNSVNDVQIVVNNVVQYPPNYSVSGTTLTISPAPSAGTNNVYARYLSTTLQSIAPSQGIGIQFGIGSLALPSISFIGDTNTGIYSPAADTIAFVEGGTEAMRIDSSANVGIGTSSPSCRLEVKTSAAEIARFSSSATNGGYQIFYPDNLITPVYVGSLKAILATGNATDFAIVGTGANNMVFGTNSAERARINSSGSLLVGTTGAVNPGVSIDPAGRINIGRSNDDAVAEFYRSGTRVGQINVTTTNTSYITSSDYRLKEAITPMTGALAKVAQLKPCTYKWNVDGSDGQGFIAHELAEVVPDCVTGEKDAVNEDGSIKPQGIDTSFLVATLTAAIQEQQAMIDTMKQEIAELKAKVGE